MVTNNLLTFVDIAGVMGRLRGAPSMAGWSCPTWNRLPRPPHRRRPGQRPTWKPLQKCHIIDAEDSHNRKENNNAEK